LESWLNRFKIQRVNQILLALYGDYDFISSHDILSSS
jgi:hypothetical protein